MNREMKINYQSYKALVFINRLISLNLKTFELGTRFISLDHSRFSRN